MTDIERNEIIGRNWTEFQPDHFRLLDDSYPTGIFISDSNGHLFYVNSSFCRFASLPQDQALGEGWMNYLHPDDSPNVRQMWKQSIKGKNPFTMEFRFQNPQGIVTWVLCEATPQEIKDEKGKRLAFCGSLVDITSHKLQVESFKETENQFRYIIKHSPFSIAVFDADMCYLAASDQYLKDFYYEVNDIIGRNHYDVTPEMPQRWRDYHAGCLKGEVASAQRDVFTHKNGKVDYINWECRPWYGKEGAIGGIVLFTEIVTEKKIAEDALKQSEERYRSLIETSPDSVVFFDLEGNFVTPNDQTALMHGYSSIKEMLQNGSNAADFIAGEDHEHFQKELKRILDDGKVSGLVLKAIKKDGSKFTIEVNATAQLDPEGKPFGITAVARDISNRIEIEKIHKNQQLFSEVLHETTLTIRQSLDLSEVLNQILISATRVVEHDAANIMMIEGDNARVVGSHGYKEMGLEDVINSLKLDIDKNSNLKVMAETGQPYFHPDVSSDPTWNIFPGFEWMRSYVSAPIKTKEKVVGFINLDCRKPDFYHSIDAQRLQAFADQAAVAIENANLYEQSRLQAEENAALYRASMPLLKPGSDIQSLAGQIAETVTQEFSRAHVGVLLVDEEGEELILMGQGGYMNLIVPPLPLDGKGLTVAAFNSGEIIYTPDITLDSRFIRGAGETKSELDIPLRVGDHVLGVLNLENPSIDGFSERDRRILSSYADRASLALENALLFSRLNQHVDRLAMLNAITRTALEEAELQTILDKQGFLLMRLIQGDGICISMWDPHLSKSTPIVIQGNLLELGDEIKTSAGESTYTSAVLEAQQPLVIKPEDRSRYLSSRLQDHKDFGVVLALPLITGSQKIGAVMVTFTKSKVVIHDRISLAEQACGQIALAVAKSQLLDFANRRANEAENLRLATTKLASTLSMQDVLEIILDHLKQVVNYDTASVFLRKQKFYEISASKGFKVQVAGETAPFEDFFIQQITKTKQPIILTDATKETNFKRLGDSDKVRGWMCIPLVIADEVIGFLTIDSFTKNAFNEDSMNIAQAYANQAAIAVQNARLFNEEKNRARELEGLHNATMSLVSTFTDIKALLERILHVTATAIPASDRAILFLKDNKTDLLHTRAEYGYADPRIRSLTFRSDEGYPGKAMTSQAGILVDNMQADQDRLYKGDIAEAREIRSSILAPLISENTVLGVLTLESLKPGAFTESDLRLLTSFASTATAALRNAQLHAEVQELAIRDPLTGLLNRRGFFEQGIRELVRAQRGDYPLSVIMVDADRLKKINDTFGHATGDMVLKIIAEKFTSTLRKIDLVCRYGGDEFTILLPDTDAEGALEVAEKLKSIFSKTKVRTDKGDTDVSVSMGIAILQDSYTNLEGLLMQADEALYNAKASGRGSYQISKKM